MRSIGRDHLLVVAVALAVALAVADSAVVVLALPDIYGTFDVSIVAVSWTITAYNLAIVVGALAVLPVQHKVRGHVIAAVGLALLSVASLVCGFANSFPVLMGGRVVQGFGAALALAGAVPVLAGIRGSDEHAIRVWATAGTMGLAFGPAFGGLVTQLFSWRAIFLLQAPFAAIAFVAVFDRRAREVEIAARAERGRLRVLANLGFFFLYGALVGALFLAVLLIVIVWGWSPLTGALVVTSLPVGAIAVRRLVPNVPARLAIATGGVALAGGLIALAYLPAARAVWAAPALAACGLGLGFLSGILGPAAVPSDEPGVRAATISIAARHAGFVLALAVIAPVLAASLTNAALEATRATTAAIIEAPVSLRTKVSLALDLRDLVADAPRGEVPDPNPVFDKHGATTNAGMAQARDSVLSSIRDTLTRHFRGAFLIAALFAAAAAIAALLLPIARRGPPNLDAIWVAVAIIVLAGVLVAAELRAGARDFGTRDYVDTCHAPADPYPQGTGIDGTLQRITLSALDGAACRLGTSREELLLSLQPSSGFGGKVRWTRATLEDAVRAGLVQAIDDADHRNTIPGFVATGLKFLADRAPIDWVLGRVNIPFLEN